MELTIKLQPTDYLAFNLFNTAHSDTIRKRRKTEWLLTTLFFAILALIFLFTQIMLLCYYFAGVTLLSALFYPKYFAWRYKKHYKKQISSLSRVNFGEKIVIRFTEEQIYTSDENSETKINLNQIKEINETSSHFFIMLLSGTALIIPKSYCKDTDAFKNFLVSLSESFKINYNTATAWKWK